MRQKKLRMTQETESGLNTRFKNIESGRSVSREHVITQIENGNPSYSDYHIVRNPRGEDFIRSNPDGKVKNNLE